jgi:effector-binding domain-containing protein
MVTSIEQATFLKRKYLGVKQTIKFEEVSNKEIYANAYELLGKYFAEEGIIPSGPATTVYFTWDMETQISKMAPSFPVLGIRKSNDDAVKLFDVPESQAVVAHHEGDYATLKDAHEEMMAYIKENNIEMSGFAIEEYLVDPNTEPDSSKWKTDIWYLMK